MLVNLNSLLPRARKNGYAVGAFNFNDLEFLQAILEAAEELKSPVILQTSEGAIKYMGLEYIKGLAKDLLAKIKIPVVLHLDHGRNLALIKRIISAGFYSSVMFDGSHLPYEKNVSQTKTIVKLAHAKKMSVEAELGMLKGIEDGVGIIETHGNASLQNVKTHCHASLLTDPEQAADFVKKTNCDALAVAIGTSHGAYKFKGKPKLDLKRLAEIAKLVKIPLVLHGASSIAHHQGLPGAKGVPDSQITKAIKLGVAKVNIDTDLRLAFTAAVRKNICADQKIIDPRDYLGPAREAVKEVVKEKIKLFKKNIKY